MFKTIFIALFLIFIAGCETAAPQQYGSFITNTPASFNGSMANDVVKQLLVLYPPGSTRFNFQQTATDSFGTLLIKAMRANGYAVLEIKQNVAQTNPVAKNTDKSSLPLNYIIDQISTMSLYRVTLIIGNQTLSRAYQVNNKGLAYPVGPWLKKE